MLAVFFALALGQAGMPPDQAGRAESDWWRIPMPKDAPLFPAHAWIHRIEGFAVTSCTVMANGELTACRTIEERPKGEEFGKAALKAMKYYRARPLMRDGQPVDGGVVTIPISFTHRR